jgi:hypothetical protein
MVVGDPQQALTLLSSRACCMSARILSNSDRQIFLPMLIFWWGVQPYSLGITPEASVLATLSSSGSALQLGMWASATAKSIRMAIISKAMKLERCQPDTYNILYAGGDKTITQQYSRLSKPAKRLNQCATFAQRVGFDSTPLHWPWVHHIGRAALSQSVKRIQSREGQNLRTAGPCGCCARHHTWPSRRCLELC